MPHRMSCRYFKFKSKSFIIPWPPDSVGKCIMFLGSPVRPFVRSDVNCYHDISWTAWTVLIKLTGNIH